MTILLDPRPSADPASVSADGSAPANRVPEARNKATARPHRFIRFIAIAAAITGLLERIWVGVHPLGTLTSDGSVIGLMAADLLHHGQLPAYMWGQSYGGSLEPLGTAIVFALFGVGTAQLLATTVVSSILATLALWRTGRVIVGERAALLGALAFWVWPATFIWRSLKPGGTYIIGLAIALCAVGALVRLRNEARHGISPTAIRLAWTGLLCGLAVWSSPMSLQLLVPALLWVSPTLWGLGRRFLLVLAGAVLGAFPALVFGATHHWSNLAVPGGTGLFAGFGSRIAQFFSLEAPISLSLREEGSFAWVGGALGFVLALGAAIAFMSLTYAVLRGRSARCRLPIITMLCLPVLFALNQIANHLGQGRYVLFGSSMAALLVGVGLDRGGAILARRRSSHAHAHADTQPHSADASGLTWAAFGLALLAILGIFTVSHEPAALLVGFSAPDVPMPTDTQALDQSLAAHHVTAAFADYWIAYRATFETDQHTVVTPTSFDRYPPLAHDVVRSAHPAYIFVSTSLTLTKFETWCVLHGVAFTAWPAGAFTVVQPQQRLLPRDLPRQVFNGDKRLVNLRAQGLQRRVAPPPALRQLRAAAKPKPRRGTGRAITRRAKQVSLGVMVPAPAQGPIPPSA